MSYFSLDEKSVIDYFQRSSALSSLFPPGVRLEGKEVGNGNLNLVFIVRDQGDHNQAFVIKQALPYLRVAGESWPLTLERNRFETEALRLYEELIPGFVPAVYASDPEMCLFVMEYLGKHQIMREGLLQRKRYPRFLEHITDFLSQTLFYTSDLYLTGVEKKELQRKFINPEMCKVQEDLVFTNPFHFSLENHWNPLLNYEIQQLRRNNDLKVKVARLKEKYMNHAQALIHSDLHTGSIMINETDTRIIDPEFIFFGPMGYDLAALIQNLALNYLAHFVHTPDRRHRLSYQIYLIELMQGVWEGFARKIEQLWRENNRGDLAPERYWAYEGGNIGFAHFRKAYLQDVFADMVAIAGIKMLRRMIGFVSVWEFSSIQDVQRRAQIERLAIQVGMRWVLEAGVIHRIEDMLRILIEEAEREPSM